MALDAVVKLTTPLPVPAALFTVIQLVAVLAVHAQVAALAVRETVDAPPAPVALTVDGDSANVQAGAAAWLTVYVFPPAVTVAVRAAPVLAAAVTVTAPEPVPLAGDTVAHVALLDAVQPHVVPFVFTVTLDVPPVAANDPVDEESV